MSKNFELLQQAGIEVEHKRIVPLVDRDDNSFPTKVIDVAHKRTAREESLKLVQRLFWGKTQSGRVPWFLQELSAEMDAPGFAARRLASWQKALLALFASWMQTCVRHPCRSSSVLQITGG